MTSPASDSSLEVNLDGIKDEIENLESDLAALRDQLKRSREALEGKDREEYLRAYA